MKIGLLDHMGYGNLGDAATQDVIIANIKKRLPDANIVGFSLNPDDTTNRHCIPCYSITHWHPGIHKSVLTRTDNASAGFRLKGILKRLPILGPLVVSVRELLRELLHLRRCVTVIRSLDSLIIAGGGQLSELWRGPWSHPYNVFKFCVLTKIANTKLLFLNVGAGPLDTILSRIFIRYSICVADYVSVRDVESQALLREIGVKRQTHVFPDSAYALDVSSYMVNTSAIDGSPVVGINPIGFCDPRIWPKKDAIAYSRYLDKLGSFIAWLLRNNCRIKVFSGELSVDTQAIEDLKARLSSRLRPQDRCVFQTPRESVRDLLTEMSQLDYVITSKFHGVVFSHLLGKPVIALSYHKKIDDLMTAVGHARYCTKIDTFDDESLQRLFKSLLEDANDLRRTFRRMTHTYSEMLRKQFDELFVLRRLQPQLGEIATEGKPAIVGRSA